MSRQRVNELKPFLSLLFIIGTLLGVVFCKMEVRRLGYSVLKEAREFKNSQDLYRSQVIEYARYTSPARLSHLAQTQLTLSDARMGQIIQLSGTEIALRQ